MKHTSFYKTPLATALRCRARKAGGTPHGTECRGYKFILLQLIFAFALAGGMTRAADGESSASQIASVGDCQLLMPKVIYATPGLETNIYFRNVVLDSAPNTYRFKAESAVGTQQSERWTWVPAKEDAGDHPVKIEVRDLDDQVLAMGETLIHVAPADAGAGKEIKVLCIGDSLTGGGIYTGELLRLGSGGENPIITLLGTNSKGDPKNRHEGYGGWRWHNFIDKWVPDADANAEKKSQSSPFLFLENGSPTLNFRRYLEEKLNREQPDCLVVMLGTNQEKIDSLMSSARTLVAAIREALPTTPIAVVPPPPPNASEDAFKSGTQTRKEYRKSQHEIVLQLMQEFGNRESENIFVIPAYVNLDCEHNFPVNNSVHPTISGYFQIANSIFSWVKVAQDLRASHTTK